MSDEQARLGDAKGRSDAEGARLRKLREELLDKIVRDGHFSELIEHTAGTDQLDELPTGRLIEILEQAKVRATEARVKLNEAHARLELALRVRTRRLVIWSVGLSILA